MKATVFLLLGLVALACADLQTFMSAMTPSATHPGCVRFSPYVNGLSPNGATAPDAVLIGKLLDVLVQKTKFRCIMIGDMSGIYSKVVEAASTRGIKVFGVIYISSDFKTNGDINEAIRLSKLYTSTVIGLSCGLEVAYENKDLVGSATVVNRCIKQLRDGGVKQPIGYCETFYSWCGNNDWPCSNVYSQVYENVDFVGLSQFAWWENIMSKNFPCVKARDALDFTITKITELKRELGDSKPILLTSHGWPGSNGDDIISTANKYTGQTCGVANSFNQKAVNQRLINYLGTNKIGSSLYTAFSEPWLTGGDTSNFASYWGMCSSSAPYACDNAPGVMGTLELEFPPETTVLNNTRVAPGVSSPTAPISLIIGTTIGGVTVLLFFILLIVVVIVLILYMRRKYRKQENHAYEEVQKLILRELCEKEPNFEKIENNVIGCGTNLKNPIKILVRLVNIIPNSRNLATYLRLADHLAMFALIQKSEKKTLKKKVVKKIIAVQDHLKRIQVSSMGLQFNYDNATGYLDLLVAIGQNRTDVLHVVEVANAKTAIAQCLKSINHSWLYHLMLLRLVAQAARNNIEHVNRLMVASEHSNWHVTYAYVQLLTAIVPFCADNTLIQIELGEAVAVEQSKIFGKLFTNLASCSLYSQDQNKAIRQAMLLAMRDIMMSTTCNEAIKAEIAMVLTGRQLLETDPEVASTARSVIQLVYMDAYKEYIESSWGLVTSWYTSASEKVSKNEFKMVELARNIAICENAIQDIRNQLASMKEIETKQALHDRKMLQDRIQVYTTHLETLVGEKDMAQQSHILASSEFSIIKNNFAKMQTKYKVPQVEINL